MVLQCQLPWWGRASIVILVALIRDGCSVASAPASAVVNIDFPPALTCLDRTSLPVSYSLTVEGAQGIKEEDLVAQFNGSDICFTLQGMGQSWCGPLASQQTPLFEQISPGWHHLVYWVEPRGGGGGGGGGADESPITAGGGVSSRSEQRVLIPFRISDPDQPDCAARCPHPLAQRDNTDTTAQDDVAWLCPESETRPHVYIVTPRPGRIVSTETRIPISVKIEGISTPEDRLHFELLRDGSEEGDLLNHWSRVASPGQLAPLPVGDYRLTARLVRLPASLLTTTAQDLEHSWRSHVIAAAGPLRFHVRPPDDSGSLDEGSYLREEGFRQIWVDKYWGVAGMGSGLGSTLEASQNDRAFLTDLILQHGIKHMYDAGCGSAHWQPHLLRDLQEQHQWPLRYHGSDIVPEVIQRNREVLTTTTSSSHPTITRTMMAFLVADLVRDPVPPGPDLIVCRHALFHNTNAGIRAILERFNASTTAKWLAATTLSYVSQDRMDEEQEAVLGGGQESSSHLSSLNRDGVGTDGRLIAMGGYRPIDLQAPPFHLPPPLAFRPDGTCKIRAPQGGWYVGGLGVWRLPLPPWPTETAAAAQ